MPKPETHSPTRESSYKTATANRGGETAKCTEDGEKEVPLQDEDSQATSTAEEEVEMSTVDGEVDMEVESMETEENVPSVADRSVTSSSTQEARGRSRAPKETSSSEMMHKTRLARGISSHTRISRSTKQAKRSAEGSRGTGNGLTETESAASLSPKRKVPDDWDAAGREETGGKGQATEGPDPVGKTRSSSPAKRYKGGQGKKEKEAQQSYMHQFLQQIQTIQSDADKDEKTVVGSQVTSQNVKSPGDQERVDRESSEVAKQNTLEKDGFQITGVKAADESSQVLDTWLAVLGGTVVDVAANGQCGWLACYAAMSNVQDGLMNPTAETTVEVNSLKKHILNGMIANLVDEAQLHPEQLDVEAKASEAKLLAGAAQEDKIQAVAEIYVAQRKKSVKASVPYTMWVRPAHVKGMAMHARESIYVLDVQEDNSTQLQVYAYQDIELPSGDTIESGTVTVMSNQDGIRLLQELIGAGILPLVGYLSELPS